MKTDKIKDVKIPIDVIIGSTQRSVDYIAGISSGTVIELESLAGEPVLVTAAGEPIARGEVVVIDENFGVRITKVLNEEE